MIEQQKMTWCRECGSDREYFHDWHPIDLEGAYYCAECCHQVDPDEGRHLTIAEPLRSIVNGMFPK